MENFIFQNPVKLIMGRGMIARLAKEIPSDKRIMITFGGGSVKKNGVYDQVKEALKNHYTVEFWGIEPNPAIETLRKAIALGKEEKVDYLLYYIINEIEYAIPTDRRITSGVTSPKVTGKCTILTT